MMDRIRLRMFDIDSVTSFTLYNNVLTNTYPIRKKIVLQYEITGYGLR